VPAAAETGIDDVKKKVEDALKRVKNLPKDIEEAKRKVMGKAPVMLHTPSETADKTKSVISGSMALIGEIERMILDMEARFGPGMPIDMKGFDVIKRRLSETSSHIDSTMKEAAEAERQGEELKKELSGIIRKNIPPEEINKAGIDPDMLIAPEKINPWHDRGFPLVVKWCKDLKRDTDTLKRLYGMGFNSRTIERAWMGINRENYSENAELWGIGKDAFAFGEEHVVLIPAGLVLPFFNDATLTGICVRHEDFSKASKEVFVKGSEKCPLFLPAGDRDGTPVVGTISRLKALYVEQEIGDACSVIVLESPDDEPGKEGIEAIKAASAFVIILPELSSKEDLSAWQRAYPKAKKVTLPKGNTVFEARENGTDIRHFIMKNLPEDFAVRHSMEFITSGSGDAHGKSPVGTLVVPAFDAAAMVDQFAGDIKAFLKPQVDEIMAYEKDMKAKARDELIKAGKDPAEVALFEEELSKKTVSQVGQDTVEEINRVKERLKAQGVLTREYEQKMNEMAERADRLSKTAENMYAEGMKKLEDAKDRIEKAKAGELPDEVRQQLKEAGIDPDKVKKLSREEVIERYKKEKSLAGAILNGTGLSGLDLHGVDLSDAQCQKTNFSGTNLDGAVFVQTIATEANFSGASLVGALVEKALFPRAVFKKARMTDVRIGSTVLQEVDLTETDLSRATFKMSIVQKSKMDKTLLTDIYADMTVFDESDAYHAVFTGARFVKCLFQKTILDNADFSAAILDSTMIFSCKGKDVKFIGAELKKGRIAGGSVFSGANFRQMKMIRGCLRESDFSYADMQRSTLDFSMIESCDLRGAKFAASSAKHVRFTKSDLEAADMRGVNLFQGSLRKARLVNTDFRGASLFGVDFYKAIMGNTNLEKVNLKRTFLEKRVDLLK